MSETSPLVFAGDQPSSTLNRQVKDGALLRIVPGVYSTDVRTAAPVQVQRHWREIVGHEIPGAVVVDRSAIGGGPRNGFLFVDSGPDGRATPLQLPGLTVIPRRGPGPLPGDIAHNAGVRFSSLERALADNARQTRSRGDRPAATLTDDEIADWADHLAARFGPDELIRLRVEAERIATTVGTDGSRMGRVSALLGAAIGTQQVETNSRRLAARQANTPYDDHRVELFNVLGEHLRSVAPSSMRERDPETRTHLPFYEAYFSNYIEGTEFTIDEAVRVLYDRDEIGRPQDAHDVCATYDLVADPEERRRVPESADEFIDLLRERHRHLMAARPEKEPGEFKTLRNRAGSTEFVHPDLVVGTLNEGWTLIDSLDDPFDRAIATMFVVAEVHPFNDGNGRMARIMMNAELSAEGEERIIIPTGLRTEYLTGLSALTNNGQPKPLGRVMAFAQQWTHQVDFGDLNDIEDTLIATNALVDPADAQRDNIRLILPSAVGRWDEDEEDPEAELIAARQHALDTYKRDSTAGDQALCNVWMPRAQARCGLPKGHKDPEHRSLL
jgi:hypothetical protein